MSGFFSAVYVIFWLWMLVDCLLRKFKPGQGYKALWFFAMLFIPFLDVVYFFVVPFQAWRKKQGSGP
jgi:hypothetical protein